MSTLLVWREKLQRLYASYSIYILKGSQFLLGLILFGLINYNIGFMKMASSVFCTAGLAVICTFLPMVIMVIAASALILVHFYALSLPIAFVSAVIFLLMYIFYFRFTPKKAWLVLIAALAFGLKIPFVIPVAFGLMGTPVWIVPAACGVISYYMVDFVKGSAAALKSADADGIAASLAGFTKQVLGNKEMWLMIMAVVIGILVQSVQRGLQLVPAHILLSGGLVLALLTQHELDVGDHEDAVILILVVALPIEQRAAILGVVHTGLVDLQNHQILVAEVNNRIRERSVVLVSVALDALEEGGLLHVAVGIVLDSVPLALDHLVGQIALVLVVDFGFRFRLFHKVK